LAFTIQLLATQRPELDRLRTLSVNVQICGYDACTPNALDTLYRRCCDPSRPFGHEMVILTLLLLPAQRYLWPDFRR
jgi:hypothetical protein